MYFFAHVAMHRKTSMQNMEFTQSRGQCDSNAYTLGESRALKGPQGVYCEPSPRPRSGICGWLEVWGNGGDGPGVLTAVW